MVLILAAPSEGAGRQMAARTMSSASDPQDVQGFVAGPIVTGAPYAARGTTEFTTTLTDGTKIHRESGYTISRDADGRLRREDADTIWIVDPVAHVSYLLTPSNRTAQQFPLTAMDGRGGMPQRGMSAQPQTTTGDAPHAMLDMPMTMPSMSGRAANHGGNATSLGTRTIEGVEAAGMKTTSTWPAGSLGNDRPIVVVNEHWYANDLKVVVMSRTDDPRTGVTTFRLTQIDRSDPDPALFRVPAGYHVIPR